MEIDKSLVRGNELIFRFLCHPRLQYRVILAVGLPVMALLFIFGGMPWLDVLGGIAGVVLGPVVAHRFLRRFPAAPWIPQTVAGKLDQMAWRLGLGEHHDSDPGPRTYVGDFLDDPERLEEYLHPSFELVQSGEGSEVWRSDDLLAVLRRDALRIQLLSAEDEEAFEPLVASAVRGRLTE